MLNSFSLKSYSSNYFDFVYKVKKISYYSYVEQNYGGWDENFQMRFHKNFIATEQDNIKIIEVSGEDAGFVNGKNREDGTYEQGNICLLPKFQRKGIGSAILQNIISLHSKQDIYLKVFKQNPAKRLYERLGFRVYDETESHFLMVKDKTKN